MWNPTRPIVECNIEHRLLSDNLGSRRNDRCHNPLVILIEYSCRSPSAVFVSFNIRSRRYARSCCRSDSSFQFALEIVLFDCWRPRFSTMSAVANPRNPKNILTKWCAENNTSAEFKFSGNFTSFLCGISFSSFLNLFLPSSESRSRTRCIRIGESERY